MKRIANLFVMIVVPLCMFTVYAQTAVAQNVEIPMWGITNGNSVELHLDKIVTCNNSDVKDRGNLMPKSPSRKHLMNIEASSVYMCGQFSTVMLAIYKDGGVLYEECVPAFSDKVDLPFVFSVGDYEVFICEEDTIYHTTFSIFEN